jgi:hypothetical protein
MARPECEQSTFGASKTGLARGAFRWTPWPCCCRGFSSYRCTRARGPTFHAEQRPIPGSEKNHYRYLSECQYSPKCAGYNETDPSRPLQANMAWRYFGITC